MDFLSRGTRPPVPAQHQPTTHASQSTGKPKGKSLSGLLRWLVIAVSVIVISSLFWVVAGKLRGSEASHINSDQYQAVFLTNNQVYFGKITDMNSEFFVLTDVFYIETPSQSQADTSATNTNYTLRKLGTNELHAPEDKMVINREQVTFWENLQDDSQVVNKIKEYKANPDAANQQSSGSNSNQNTETTPTESTPTEPTPNATP